LCRESRLDQDSILELDLRGTRGLNARKQGRSLFKLGWVTGPESAKGVVNSAKIALASDDCRMSQIGKLNGPARASGLLGGETLLD